MIVLLQSTQSLGFYISRSNTQVGVEADGLEGLDTVPFEEPFTGLTLSDLSAIPYHSYSFLFSVSPFTPQELILLLSLLIRRSIDLDSNPGSKASQRTVVSP